MIKTLFASIFLLSYYFMSMVIKTILHFNDIIILDELLIIDVAIMLTMIVYALYNLFKEKEIEERSRFKT